MVKNGLYVEYRKIGGQEDLNCFPSDNFYCNCLFLVQIFSVVHSFERILVSFLVV